MKTDTIGERNILKLVDTTLMELQKNEAKDIIYYNKLFQEILYKRLQMEVDIKRTLKDHEFKLYLQPLINPINNQVTSAEALIRWKHNNKFIGPDVFIPIAEDMGIIENIGMWVIDEAVKHVHRLKIRGNSVPIAVNVSAKQINSRLVKKFRELIEFRIIDPEDISIEITESVLLHFKDQKVELLHELAALGVKIAIDDFGAGYSSMRYLRTLPISKLKIDKYFIDNIQNSNDKLLLRTMIIMAKELGLESVAEGVETEEQLQLMIKYEVDSIQGWYYVKAMPVDEFIDYVVKE